MKTRVTLIVICLLCTIGRGFAREDDRFYEAEVVVKSQTREDRNTALNDALTRVLSRLVSGKEDLADPTVQAVLTHAADYVQAYQYLPIADDARLDGQAQKMRVRFDGAALLNALQAAPIAVWDHKRLPILIWLTVTEKGPRDLFDPEVMPEINTMLQQAAHERGLTVLLPLLDLEERRQISVEALAGGDEAALRPLSKRYAVESILTGEIVKKNTCWIAAWRLIYADKSEQWSQSCGRLNELMAQAMQKVHALLFKHYTAEIGPPRSNTLKPSSDTLVLQAGNSGSG